MYNRPLITEAEFHIVAAERKPDDAVSRIKADAERDHHLFLAIAKTLLAIHEELRSK